MYGQSPYAAQNMSYSGMYGSSMPMNAYAMNPQMQMNGMGMEQQYGKGKGKLSTADFESAFAEASKNWGEVAKSGVVEVSDDTTTATLEEAMRKAKLEDSQINANAEFKQ